MSEKEINVGIGFVTGRKSFLKVLRTYIYSWKECGLTTQPNLHLHVFVAYDLRYNDTKSSDFTLIGKDLAREVEQIHLISAESLKAQAQQLVQRGVLSAQDAQLFFSSGYAAMRNAVLYEAVKCGMDSLLFLDDDEYPLAVTNNHGAAIWSGQQMLAKHLEAIKTADITNGYHCGYISPIPSIEFGERLPEADFRNFIEALSNDILNWDKIREIIRVGGVTYADTDVLMRNTPHEVEEVNGCKFISGANLCLSLRDAQQMSPFYNPPGARGEDTFLSTCLHDKKVVRIPCYAFHDGFATYNHLLNGVLPSQLKPICGDSRGIVNRFYNACIGWVRYKPLLLYITQRGQYQQRIAEMRGNLQSSLPAICTAFRRDDFNNVLSELDHYDAAVEEHYAQFLRTGEIWRTLCADLAANGGAAKER